MKMILILLREFPNKLYTPYMDGEEIWKTEDDLELENKLLELLNTYPKQNIHPVSDLSWMVDVILGD